MFTLSLEQRVRTRFAHLENRMRIASDLYVSPRRRALAKEYARAAARFAISILPQLHSAPWLINEHLDYLSAIVADYSAAASAALSAGVRQ